MFQFLRACWLLQHQQHPHICVSERVASRCSLLPSTGGCAASCAILLSGLHLALGNTDISRRAEPVTEKQRCSLSKVMTAVMKAKQNMGQQRTWGSCWAGPWWGSRHSWQGGRNQTRRQLGAKGTWKARHSPWHCSTHWENWAGCTWETSWEPWLCCCAKPWLCCCSKPWLCCCAKTWLRRCSKPWLRCGAEPWLSRETSSWKGRVCGWEAEAGCCCWCSCEPRLGWEGAGESGGGSCGGGTEAWLCGEAHRPCRCCCVDGHGVYCAEPGLRREGGSSCYSSWVDCCCCWGLEGCWAGWGWRCVIWDWDDTWGQLIWLCQNDCKAATCFGAAKMHQTAIQTDMQDREMGCFSMGWKPQGVKEMWGGGLCQS